MSQGGALQAFGGMPQVPRRPACWTFRRLRCLCLQETPPPALGNWGSQSPDPYALPMKGVRNLSIFPWVRLASLSESTNHQAGAGDSAFFSGSRPPDDRMLDVGLPTAGHLIGWSRRAVFPEHSPGRVSGWPVSPPCKSCAPPWRGTWGC